MRDDLDVGELLELFSRDLGDKNCIQKPAVCFLFFSQRSQMLESGVSRDSGLRGEFPEFLKS